MTWDDPKNVRQTRFTRTCDIRSSVSTFYPVRSTSIYLLSHDFTEVRFFQQYRGHSSVQNDLIELHGYNRTTKNAHFFIVNHTLLNHNSKLQVRGQGVGTGEFCSELRLTGTLKFNGFIYLAWMT